jgi:membrane glycosyltransferase
MRILVTEEMDAGRLNRRRFIFFSSILVLTSLATWFVADLYWRDADGLTGLEIILLVLFVPLFAHISVGFCTAFAGFYVINRGGDSSRISLSAPAGAPPRDRDAGLQRGRQQGVRGDTRGH